MAREKTAKERLDAVECRICEDPFDIQGNKVPRLLSCGHSVCHDCLTKLPLSGHTVLCPFDRQATQIGDSGVWGLRKNFALLELLERLDATKITTTFDISTSRSLNITCDEDATHIAIVYCTVCDTNLCEQCLKSTHHSKTLSRHKHVPVSEKPSINPCCRLHPNHVLEFACLEEGCTDDSLICYICKDYGAHQGHKHVLLASEAEHVRSLVTNAMQHMGMFSSEMSEFASKLSNVIERIEGGAMIHAELDEASQAVEFVRGTAETVREHIRSYFTDLRETIDRQEEAGLAVVDCHIHERLCSLRQQQEEVSMLMHQVSSVCQECDVTKRKSDAEVIRARTSILGLLDKVQKKQEEFSCLAEFFRDDASIPVTFTKDNRVHIGPKLEMRIVALGLDNAGKTSILFKLKQNEFVSPITTIGFNVETVEHKALKFTIWDVGGIRKLRPLWRHYYLNTQAVIFVVDSTDHERFPEAREELGKLIAEKRLQDALLLVFANKQDLPNALSVERVTEMLGLQRLCCGRSWSILGSDAHSGEGLQDGLDWLARQLMSEFEP